MMGHSLFQLFPLEVLSQIFTRLHIEDRKHVRLVCKKWYNCCNCPTIVRREKFCFRSGCSIESIDLFLQNCEQLRSTIEFQGLPLDQLSNENTWRLIGPKIYSLSLIECEVSNETTKNIFLYCQNMHTYKLMKRWSLYSPNIRDHLCSPETLDELIELNIERPKMISFQLLVGCVEVPNDIIQKIFKIFPCIQNYGNGHISYACEDFGNSAIVGFLEDTINPALIKELTFNLPSTASWLHKFANVSQKMKLQKLEIILAAPSLSIDNLMHFLDNQSELQILKIGWMGFQSSAATLRILTRSLINCLKLLDLRLKTRVDLKMNDFYRVLQLISKSKLECFMLWFTPVYEPNEEALDPPTPFANKRLHTLNLGTGGKVIPENYCLPILKHFCNLHHLEIDVASDKILQTIFQYHTNLKTLNLRKIENCTAFGFTGLVDSVSSDSTVQKEETYSISRLSKLMHLEVQGFLEHCWVEKTVREFKFPRLKYLLLSLWGLCEDMNFEYLCTAIPSVEILIFYEVPLCEDQLLLFCQHMGRLKLLSYTSFWNEKMTKQLFNVRSSLKYAVDSVDTAYFFDRFTKSIKLVNFRDLLFKKSVFEDFI